MLLLELKAMHNLLTNYRKSKWTKDTSPFSVEIVRSASKSVGDAMRDLDQKQLVKGDFLCVYGDVVANVSIEAALVAHRARREKKKNAIMTMLLREAGESHRTKSKHMRPCFVIDPEVERCVHYEQVWPRRSTRLDIAEEVLKDHVEIEIREDLIDCGIDICTPEVLAQWSDNFDWQAPRRGFLYGVLKDFETNNLTIHTHVLSEGYAARVKNLRAYDAISKDVVSRWTYPLTPDSNLLADQSFQLGKGCVYKEDEVILARSCKVGPKTIVGRGTTVGEGSSISNSVIGRRCVIGRKVKIDGAFIWDDARIGDNTVVEKAVIANDAVVGKGCTISCGALLSYGVRIADHATVDDSARITRHKRKRGHDDDGIMRGITDPKVVGEGGEGFLLELDEEEEDVVESVLAGVQDLDISMIDDSASDLDSDAESEAEYQHQRSTSRSESFTSITSDEGGETAHRVAADFHHEAVASIFDSLQKDEDPDTIQLELRSYFLATNAESKSLRRAVAVAFSKRMASLVESGKSPKDAVAATIPGNKLLIWGCVVKGADGKDEQAEFMLFLQADLVHRQQGSKLLLFASNALATGDLVVAEGFETWWEDPRSWATEELKEVRKETKQLVDVLVGDDEDESDEEEDEDDSDD